VAVDLSARSHTFWFHEPNTSIRAYNPIYSRRAVALAGKQVALCQISDVNIYPTAESLGPLAGEAMSTPNSTTYSCSCHWTGFALRF